MSEAASLAVIIKFSVLKDKSRHFMRKSEIKPRQYGIATINETMNAGMYMRSKSKRARSQKNVGLEQFYADWENYENFFN